jgi:hypothetical protein
MLSEHKSVNKADNDPPSSDPKWNKKKQQTPTPITSPTKSLLPPAFPFRVEPLNLGNDNRLNRPFCHTILMVGVCAIEAQEFFILVDLRDKRADLEGPTIRKIILHRDTMVHA